jgi:general secretion pathway protein D
MTRKERGLTLRLAALAVLGVLCLSPALADPPEETTSPAPPPLPPAPRQAPPVVAPAIPAAPSPATPAPVVTKPGEVLLNFQAADLQAVVKAISQMTNRNFLLDPRVKGQITIISARPMSAGAAYQVFLSALKAQGFTAVEGPGDVVRIIPTGEAKMAADVNQRDVPRGGEQIMTHVAAIQHVHGAQLVPVLRPLMSPTSQLSAYEVGNLLIITDYADNIRRLLQIIEKVDVPTSTDVTVIALNHASAVDITEIVMRLAGSGIAAPGAPAAPAQAAAAERFTVVPDLRTNSLLVRTENPGRLAQLRSLIEKLDVPAKAAGNTRVIYLKNAEATKLAEVLRGLLAGEARAAQAAVTPAAAGVRPVGAAAKGAEASLIQADEATNSLIINASDAVYNNLRGVIEQLDTRRAQVFVEGLIVEMTTDAANELGFQWAGASRSGNGAIGGVTNFPGAKPSILGVGIDPASALATASGLSVAFVGDTIRLPDGTEVTSLGAFARALESRNLANILSTPNLMTLDNAEAKIVVGQNVPFITGSFAQATGTTGTTVNPFQTIERKDVGLTLKIKPQISDGGTIRLDIYQEVSSVTAAATGASDLITNKRSVETKVVVDDGHTIVLGGLIEDTEGETQQAVPLLGRIPLLGALFRYKEKTNRKTNLMVFLRPTIVRSIQDGFNITVDRYNYLRAQVRNGSEERAGVLDRLAPRTPEPKETPPAPAAPNGGAQAPRDSGSQEQQPPGESVAPPAPAPTTP